MLGSLKKIRESKGLSQQDICEAVGLTYAMYNNYEAGRRSPKPETIVKIANFLQVTTDELLGRQILCPVRVVFVSPSDKAGCCTVTVEGKSYTASKSFVDNWGIDLEEFCRIFNETFVEALEKEEKRLEEKNAGFAELTQVLSSLATRHK